MIGYTRDLLYNLRVAVNIWSLSLKHDISDPVGDTHKS